jgi:hypothetical protein
MAYDMEGRTKGKVQIKEEINEERGRNERKSEGREKESGNKATVRLHAEVTMLFPNEPVRHWYLLQHLRHRQFLLPILSPLNNLGFCVTPHSYVVLSVTAKSSHCLRLLSPGQQRLFVCLFLERLLFVLHKGDSISFF